MLTKLITIRPYLTALIAGALSALALPPAGAFPILFITLPVLFLLLIPSPLPSPSGRGSIIRSFFIGWCFAFGFFVSGLYWISFSLFVDIQEFWWAVPLAVAGLPALFSIYWGLATLCFGWLTQRWQLSPAQQPFLLAAFLLLAEICRGTFFTGFPWNMLGQAWQHAPALEQSLSLFGIYGLTLLTIVLCLTPVLWAAQAKRQALLIITCALLLTAWGQWRLATTPISFVPEVLLRLVQPSIPQHLKWDRAARDDNFNKTLALSAQFSALTPTHIIWPEAAIPFWLDANEGARLDIAAQTPFGGATIMGAPWRTQFGEQKNYYNALVSINETGAITEKFYKFHLVPFGEYFPLRSLLQHLGLNVNAVAAGSADYSAGVGPQTLQLPNLPPFSPLICYEVIFSGNVTAPKQRPAWLLNLTNDAWFGQSAGPHQHFALARLRAIEEGLPLVRVANNGISGVIDPLGRVHAATKINESVALDVGLPQPLPPTLFSQIKNILPFFMLLVVFLTAITKRKVR